MENVIETRGLTKSYHGRPALRGIDLPVPRGVVCGYLGPNGAGKTTTIRILAGLIRPTAGRAELFGMDVVRRREDVQRRIGYLPGEFVGYSNLTGERYLRYFAELRGGVDEAWMRRLVERLDLDPTARIGALSHGNRQKVGIVQAFMHRPDLLVLDEPTAGLDPLAQREFLALVRESRDEGRTVFLSSHVLSEVEAVAERVAILRQGRLVVVESVDKLKARALRRMEITFEQAPPLALLRTVPGVREAVPEGLTVHLVVEGSPADLLQAAAPHRIDRLVTHEPDLGEIFVAYYEREA